MKTPNFVYNFGWSSYRFIINPTNFVCFQEYLVWSFSAPLCFHLINGNSLFKYSFFILFVNQSTPLFGMLYHTLPHFNTILLAFLLKTMFYSETVKTSALFLSFFIYFINFFVVVASFLHSVIFLLLLLLVSLLVLLGVYLHPHYLLFFFVDLFSLVVE